MGGLEERWNKRYATEAAEVLVLWAFQTSKVETMRAKILHNNIKSIRVLET
ncbi:GNAT family N-acetyltransferase [Bacillus cytotoxicus]|uniref:GNAT family N-acetyltransferase n=1 Tax=Bacillus cereus group TaxID=86661 RepID=UPI0035C79AC8